MDDDERELLSRALSIVGKKRWEGVSKKKRSELMQDAINARWEKWRSENPEKAAASEARRAKRAAAKKNVGKKKA